MNSATIAQQVRAVFDEIIAFLTSGIGKTYAKYAGYIVFATVIAIGLYFGQRQWIVYREQKAQYALSQILDNFADHQKNKDVDWDAFIRDVDDAYAQNVSSYLAPYFLNMKVEALLKQEKQKEALSILEDIVSLVDHSITGELLRTKKALLELDMGNIESGIAQLQKLAASEHNKVKDVAQFYLGRYYWISGKDEDAREVWEQLIEEQRVHRISPSPWMKEVKNLLETIA